MKKNNRAGEIPAGNQTGGEGGRVPTPDANIDDWTDTTPGIWIPAETNEWLFGQIVGTFEGEYGDAPIVEISKGGGYITMSGEPEPALIHGGDRVILPNHTVLKNEIETVPDNALVFVRYDGEITGDKGIYKKYTVKYKVQNE